MADMCVHFIHESTEYYIIFFFSHSRIFYKIDLSYKRRI